MVYELDSMQTENAMNTNQKKTTTSKVSPAIQARLKEIQTALYAQAKITDNPMLLMQEQTMREAMLAIETFRGAAEWLARDLTQAVARLDAAATLQDAASAMAWSAGSLQSDIAKAATQIGLLVKQIAMIERYASKADAK
jgi:hypothetical protein